MKKFNWNDKRFSNNIKTNNNMKTKILATIISLVTLIGIISINRSESKLNDRITKLEIRIDSIQNNLPK